MRYLPKPMFVTRWQAQQAEKAEQKRVDKIRSLGGFTAGDVEALMSKAYVQGVNEGVAQNQIAADSYLKKVVEAVRIVLELNDLSSRTLLKSVRAHLRQAEKVQKQKERKAEQAYAEMLELQAEAREAAQVAETTSGALEALDDVNLNSSVRLTLPE